MPDSETSPPPEPQLPPKRRKWRRWLVGGAVFLVAGLIWLNGPGVRWLAPGVTRHFLEKSGLRGDFKLSGSLTGGISLHDLKIEGDAGLASLTIDRIEPEYRFGELRKGELRGLTIRGVHADVRLGVEKEEKPEEEKPPLDLKALVRTLRDAQAKVRPLRLDVSEVSVTATQEEKPVFSLAPSKLTHAAGTDLLELSLGEITDARGKIWPAQTSRIVWTQDALKVDRLDPLPMLSIRELALQTPGNGEPSLATELRIDEGIFQLDSTEGFGAAQLELKEGRVRLDEVLRSFIELPVKGNLTSLSLHLDGVLPEPKAATGSLRLLAEDAVYQDWTARELGLGAMLEDARASVALRAITQGTPVSLDAEAPVARDGEAFQLGETQGTFRIHEVRAALRELATRFPAIDPEAPAPESSLDGQFQLAFDNNRPQSATAAVTLQPKDETVATPVRVEATWKPGAPLDFSGRLDGLELSGSFTTEDSSYRGVLDLKGFTSRRIEPWLGIVRVKPAGTGELSGHWEGKGNLKENTHDGQLDLANAAWRPEAGEALSANGGLDYRWPGSFETRELLLKTANQTISLDVALKEGLLQLSRLLWKDGETEIASGTASLPVPEDFADWRETLASDPRPLQVKIHSRVLSLSLLKSWAPALATLDPRSTAQVEIDVAGTYALPEVATRIEVRDLRTPDRPQLPPADLKIQINGKNNALRVDGEITAPDFPAATVTAGMPFSPAEWARNPEAIKAQPITARLDLPRLDLSRFASLAPSLESLGGTLTGNVTVMGTVGKPEPKGELNLVNGGVSFKKESVPAIRAISAAVEMNLQQVRLRSLSATIAGGNVRGEGTLALADGKLGNVDFRLRGDHVPVLRNDSLIIRAMADLRLQGPWERAALTGSVATVDSVFFKDIEILPIGTPFTAPSAAALPKTDAPKNVGSSVPEPFRDWTLNVDLSTRGPFLVRGNLATGEATGNIRVRGTIGNPAPDGAVHIRDVRATLPFSTLNVRRGTLRFTPQSGFDPILEVRGVAEPRPYRVDVYVYGKLSDPQLVLTSNPPLPENEIMTLLATGTTTSGLEDPQAASSRAMQLFAEELRRGRFGVGRQLRPLLGLLDRVDFSLSEKDPYSNDRYSTATISLTNRWYVSAGMGADGGSRVLGIWRFSFR
ncbi:MAG: translocation/assembly module TamB domain-containing protein [Luteolibacter sp.]